jgi:N-acetylglucosamine malate deacetylase 1
MSKAETIDRLDCIAVGAHPDDVEIGCGGTLISLANQGYKVGIVDLTDGEPTPHSLSPDIRLAEADRAAKVMGVELRILLDLPNRRLFDTFEARVALAKIFRRYRPKLVLGMGEKTPLASPDHAQTVQITDAAVFYSRLSKWDDVFDGLPVYTVPSYMYYTLAFDSVAIPPGAMGQIVSDISGDILETKIKAVQCYETQFKHKTGIEDHVRTLAVRYGHTAGFAAGEILFGTKAIGTRDLIEQVAR